MQLWGRRKNLLSWASLNNVGLEISQRFGCRFFIEMLSISCRAVQKRTLNLQIFPPLQDVDNIADFPQPLSHASGDCVAHVQGDARGPREQTTTSLTGIFERD